MARSIAQADLIVEAITHHPGCCLDDLVRICPKLTWNQIFLEVDRLSRVGRLRLLSLGRGRYVAENPAGSPPCSQTAHEIPVTTPTQERQPHEARCKRGGGLTILELAEVQEGTALSAGHDDRAGRGSDGGGSEFTLTFGATSGLERTGNMTGHPIEILLVEDNEDDIIIIQEAFAGARLGNVMYAVRDGEEALAYLRREGKYRVAPVPGLVLLDINMPKKNGFEVIKEMKADPTLRSIPVIMLTMSDREEDIIRSYSGGACSYIRKPVDLDRFNDVIRQFDLYWTLVSRIPARRGIAPLHICLTENNEDNTGPVRPNRPHDAVDRTSALVHRLQDAPRMDEQT